MNRCRRHGDAGEGAGCQGTSGCGDQGGTAAGDAASHRERDSRRRQLADTVTGLSLGEVFDLVWIRWRRKGSATREAERNTGA